MDKEYKCKLNFLQNSLETLTNHVRKLENSVYNVGFTTQSNSSIVKVNGRIETDRITCANSNITDSTLENVGTLCFQKEIGDNFPVVLEGVSGGSYTIYVASLQNPTVSVAKIDVLNTGQKKSITNTYEEDGNDTTYIEAVWKDGTIVLYRSSTDTSSVSSYLYNILVQGVLTNVPEIPDSIFIGFEPNEVGSWYVLGRISNSANVAPTTQPSAYIQNSWSGGANQYWTNDSSGNEQIVDVSTATFGTTPYEGTQCWYAQNLYGYTAGGAFSPKLELQSQFPMDTSGEAVFNICLRGRTIETIFYFKTFANSDDGSSFVIYNGAFQGNDRTGFNINIQNSDVGGSKIFTYSYSGGSFPITDLATNLPYQTWHKVSIRATYASDGDPNNDVFIYNINNGPDQNVPSWINVWRLDNGFPLSYGTWLLFNDSGSSGFYVDNISIRLV